jgi:hypothetical protein
MEFSGDIKGLVPIQKAYKAPFLLAQPTRFLYPSGALRARGRAPWMTAGHSNA